MNNLTAKNFIKELNSHREDDSNQKKSEFIEDDGNLTKTIGVRMKTVFDTAKKYSNMQIEEISKLLDSELYEARLGAVSIMDFQTRNKKITSDERKALFDLYISKHDRINNWGLVDRSAPRVIGWYLQDKPRDVLYKLAKSTAQSERRTAIVAPLWFITRHSEVDDAIKIAEILVNDKEKLINTALGSTLRYIGVANKEALEKFLDRHHKNMPKVTLRLATRKQTELKNKYTKTS